MGMVQVSLLRQVLCSLSEIILSIFLSVTDVTVVQFVLHSL